MVPSPGGAVRMLVEGGLKYVEGCGVPLGEILLFLGDGGMSTAEAD